MKTKSVLSLILCTMAVAVALVAPPARAQQYSTWTPALYTVAATTISNPPAATFSLDTRKQQNMAVQFDFQLSGAGTALCGIEFAGTLDGTTISTARHALTKAANGTTQVTIVTNLPSLGGFPFWTVSAITNGNATVLTNFTVKYFIKPNAP